MISVWLNILIGVPAVFGFGIFMFGMSPFETLLAVFATNLGGGAGLALVSAAGRTPWLRKYFMPNPFWTWFFFLAVFFACTVGLSPPLWDWKRFEILCIPLMMCNGF